MLWGGRRGDKDWGEELGNDFRRVLQVSPSFLLLLWGGFLFVCFCLHSNYHLLNYLVYLLLYWYTLVCLTPFMNLISFVHHCSLSISNNPWHIVKCLVNIGLMNKWPRWGSGCGNGEERAFGKSNQQGQIRRDREVLHSAGVAWRITPRFLVWLKRMDGDVTKEDKEQTVWTSESIWVPMMKLKWRCPEAHIRYTYPAIKMITSPTMQQNDYVLLRRGLVIRCWAQRANREQIWINWRQIQPEAVVSGKL